MAHISENSVRTICEICDRYANEKTPLMMILSDNIKRVFASGVKYIAEPGGSIWDDLVIEERNRKDMVMAFTGMRLFQH